MYDKQELQKQLSKSFECGRDPKDSCGEHYADYSNSGKVKDVSKSAQPPQCGCSLKKYDTGFILD
jgi:hypothetical protein